MSFLKSLFGGKQDSQKPACCDIKIVEVKDDETAATTTASAENTTNTENK